MGQKFSRMLSISMGFALMGLGHYPQLAHANKRMADEAIIQMIDQHLLQNPEIIEKAIEALKKKKLAAKQEKAAAAIKAHKNALYAIDGNVVLGASTAQDTIVVFTDPYCPYCQRYLKSLQEGLATDTSVKVILKGLPLFGEPSQIALQALIAAHKQGKYFEFYDALIEKEKPQSKEELLAIAASLPGLNQAQFQTDMHAQVTLKTLQASATLGHNLEIAAAPSSVVGPFILEGAAPFVDIKDILKKSHREGNL